MTTPGTPSPGAGSPSRGAPGPAGPGPAGPGGPGPDPSTSSSGPAGSDTEGSDPEGSDPEGSDPEGSDTEGSDTEGSDPEGSDGEGSDGEGSDGEGSDIEGSDPEGSDGEGSDTEGSARRARVVTASNRAAAGVYADRGGPIIVAWLRERGFEAPDPVVVPDGEQVGVALHAAVADGVDVVITTGGTGISPTDATPEVTRAVLDYEVPGLADAIRAAGAPTVPTAVLSRGLAGVARRTLVVNLPGSTGGVRDGLAVLADVLDHAVDQLRGGDHR